MPGHHKLTTVLAKATRASLKPALALSMCAVAGYAMAAMADRTVDQITNFSVSSASGMFQFAPNLVRIEPGETLTFLNSRGAHTVKSQKGFWPEGAPEVDITGQLEADVVFEKAGIYGVTCRRHGKYGMVMVVAVGDVEPTEEDYKKISELKANKRAKDGYQRLLWELSR